MQTPAPVLLLDRAAIAELLTLDDCIDAVAAAFAAHQNGRAFTPALSHVDADDGDFHVKSGGLRGSARSYFACKINGSFFENRARHDLPNIIGLIVLSDGATGTPLAVLESGLVTRVRTGAATAVAARYLARPDSDTVTICGAGLQAAIQLQSLTRVLPIRRAWIWSRRPEQSAATAAALGRELGIEVLAAVDLGTAAAQSDVIVTCTPARRWFLASDHVRAGTFIAAVGADGPGKQELEPALVARSMIVCDLVEQGVQVGESQHACAQGLIRRDQLQSLGSVVAGVAPGRSDLQAITLFDSTGTALQDAAAAALVYERAAASSGGTRFAFWG